MTFTRQDILRISQLPARHLAAWEREGLIRPEAANASSSEATYTFGHLSQIRALKAMYSTRVSAKNIRASVDAMQKVSGMRNPLAESTAVRRGSRINFRHGGALVDPMTRQLAFDFDLVKTQPMTVVRSSGTASAQETARSNAEIQEMFLRAVQLEEDPATIPEAAVIYDAILEVRHDHAPACINLGTILYNQRDFGRAEAMYRRATEADPDYALAFFDLGNVLDEMQDLPGAIAAYRRAIEIVPGYADAHYNIALAYERVGERRRALRHWMAYVRLDPMGPWGLHARTQARKILAMEKLAIVSGGRRLAKAR